ncbi:DUF4192 domain-containing protein [Streptomyces sp. NPDC007808]|uniref:DUF4192 domain-containing protein n=1 Tax=Streptomyces sp. NPDC007808 TaxID=3364779 RepID=UPI00367A35EE
MTKHSETTGSSENEDIVDSERQSATGAADRDRAHEEVGQRSEDASAGALDGHEPSKFHEGEGHEPNEGNEAQGCDKSPGCSRPAEQPDVAAFGEHPAEHQVTLRTPDELADALPYLLGYRPEDSIVLVALHERDGRGRFGGRARLGIPANADDWESAARQLVHGLMRGSERRGARPEQMVAFLCQEPPQGRTGRQVMERLRPLAQQMRIACGSLDVPVIEALCISDGRFWSYCCDKVECCPPEGRPMGLPGTSVLAAAATYAGLQVRGTLRELRARLMPWETAAALEQEVALDAAGMALVPRILDDFARMGVAEETLSLAERLMSRFAAATPVSGTLAADLRDDELLTHDEAARLILGLQDRTTRDRAAEWMEGDEAGPALRLWRALARRCVGPYSEHAAPPLTLAGWVAWSTGDELEAREALAMALGADSEYLFARLLHQACNEGLDPESIRRCLRRERLSREGNEPAQRTDAGRTTAESTTVVAARAGRTEAERPDAQPAGERRLDEVEDAEEPVRGRAVKATPAPCEESGRPRSVQLSASTGGSPRPAGAAGRARAAGVTRTRASGTRLGAQRPGAGTAPRASKNPAQRSPKKGPERRRQARSEVIRPEALSDEGET